MKHIEAKDVCVGDMIVFPGKIKIGEIYSELAFGIVEDIEEQEWEINGKSYIIFSIKSYLNDGRIIKFNDSKKYWKDSIAGSVFGSHDKLILVNRANANF